AGKYNSPEPGSTGRQHRRPVMQARVAGRGISTELTPIPKVPARVSLPRTSLWFNLEVSARRYPDKTAVVYCGQEFTYARLHADAQALASWLQHEAGVRRGDRVGLYLQNSPQWIIAFYGILRAD